MNCALEVRHLMKCFGGLVATNDLSFDLFEGESLGLIGPNGAGKTTIFSQIMGEIRQDRGTIRVFGDEISALSTPARIAKGIGRTYQVPRPFSNLSVRENIRVGLIPNSLVRMIFHAPDTEREDDIGLSVGFRKSDLNRWVAELPMGDLRKLEFARAIATRAKVLLLDEVFAGLTRAEIDMISELIQSLRQRGFTFLLVSHDLPVMEPLVDRAIAIDCGSLLAEGNFVDVLANEAVRTSYLGEARWLS